MGIFSSKTKRVYSSYASRLFADVPPLVRQTVQTAITGNRNIGRDLVANIANGSVGKSNAFYNYASQGSYEWGLPTSKYTHDYASVKSNIQFILEELEAGPVTVLDVIKTPASTGSTEYAVEYTKGEDPTVLLWEYDTAEGLYGNLESFETHYTDIREGYYPVIPLRLDSVNLGEDPNFEHTGDIRRACILLDLKMEDLYEGINEQAKQGDNPPEEIYVVMGVPVAQDTPAINRYLFYYFEDANQRSRVGKAEYDYWFNNQKASSSAPSTTVHIQNGSYHSTLSWDYITKEVTAGEGKRGTYSIEYIKGTGRLISGYRGSFVQATSSMRITQQTTSTSRTSYFVHGLVHHTHVLGKRWTSIDLEDAFEQPDEATVGQVFLVPLRKDLVRKMGGVTGHDLIYQSIHLFVADEFSYKVRFYETSFFQIFVLIVAVVVTVLTGNIQAGAAIWTAATANAIIQQLILALILQVGAQLVQDIAGEELGLLIAVAVALLNPALAAQGLTVQAPTVLQGLSAGLTLYKGVQTLNYTSELEAITEASDEVVQLLEDQASEEFKRALDVAAVTNRISDDPYYTMVAENFVARAKQEVREPILRTQLTERFTLLSKFTDLPGSPIRLRNA